MIIILSKSKLALRFVFKHLFTLRVIRFSGEALSIYCSANYYYMSRSGI